MKEFTFNDVPQALAQLLDKVNHLEQLITSQRPQQTPEAPEWMNLKDLQAYLPDHPAQTTVYGWIRANSIPYYKTGKKKFDLSEILHGVGVQMLLYLFALEREGKAVVIAPRDTRGFSRTERDRTKILSLWQDGYFAGYRAREAVREFWTEDQPSKA